MTDSLRAKLAPFNPELPLDRASTIPSRWYFDREIYDLEVEALFRRSWQMVGRADQLEEPGSFLTAEIAGEPVLVVRDKSGKLGAFSNICRHRGARVERRPEGKTACFVCRYHGWSYNLDGSLRGTPEWEGVNDFSREAFALPRWSAAVGGPWVFVHWGAPARDLDTFLAPLAEKMPGVDLGRYRFFRQIRYELQCNWKVFVDNYLDGGYHVRTIHPSLADVIHYAEYRTEITDRASVQISPLKKDETSEFGKVRTGDRAYYWWLHPNLMINVYENTLDTNLVLPLGPERCVVLIDFYHTGALTDSTRNFMEESIRAAHQIQKEDVDICEDVFRGLRSESYDTGRFSVRREAPGYYFHQLLARELRAALQ